MIIGISGKINSGKDTVSRLLLKNISEEVFNITKEWDSELFINDYQQFEWVLKEKTKRWELKKFAFKLKEFAGILLGQPVERFEDRDFKASTLSDVWNKVEHAIDIKGGTVQSEIKTMTVRDLLIAAGDGCRRMVHPDIWVNALLSDYKKSESKWIINDLRYKNEANSLKKLAEENDDQCFLIRINSDRVQIINNDSETDLDDYDGFDFYIENNKDTSITALEAQIRAILVKIQWAKIKKQI